METLFLDIATDTPLLDSLVYLGIVLLILSQITEKITTYIRNYIGVINPPNGRWIRSSKPATMLQGTTRWLLIKIAALDDISDLAKNRIRTAVNGKKNEVEFAITKLSILIGFMIAFICKADLIEILNSDKLPHTLLGWQHVHLDLNAWQNWRYFIQIIIGCFITGFLLTFGSKFFHDLLELLYEVKRLRRKAADEYTYRAPDFEALLQRLESRFDDPVKKILEQHKDRLMKQFSNLSSIARIFDSEGNSILEICVRDNNLEEIKKYEFDYLENGVVKKLEPKNIRYIPDNGLILPCGTGNLYVGDWVFNNAASDNMGTLGFFARQGDLLVMVTCYHALKTNQHPLIGLGQADISYNTVRGTFLLENGQHESREIGVLIDGIINEWLDCAVVKLHPDIHWFNEDHGGIGIFKISQKNNAVVNHDVWINGAKSSMGTGTIVSINNSIRINYNSAIINLVDLICIENKSDPEQSLTQEGDSGAVVVDSDGNAVGMVVAGDGKRSYALPVSRIMNAFGLTV